jgi:hypothetical protein
MAYTTINKSTDHFKTLLYVGNGSNANSITGVGFKPDLVWTKNRDHAADHYIHDIVRGVEKAIRPNVASGTYDTSINLQSFDTDGFTLGTQDGLNKSGDNIVSWNWLAGGSQGSSNTDGSTNTTYTSVNTTAGISISKWTPSGSAETVGHGLGAVPKMIITKNLGASQDWFTYHHEMGNTKYLRLNATNIPATDSNAWNNTTPTSSVFSVGSQFAGSDYVAYCFAEKTGFSKFGKYTGNGNDDGTFVYTGFRPAFVLLKNTTTDGEWWVINDSGRNPNNIVDKDLFSNNSNVEAVHSRQDFVSNGFKFKSTANNSNKNGDIYVYMAFAKAPLVGSNNVPCTAR